MSRCMRYLVSGRVQGVSYRAAALGQARELQITGYARNLEDGRVEVLACGDGADLERFERWLRQGPGQAEVSALDAEPVTAPPAVDGFQVR